MPYNPRTGLNLKSPQPLAPFPVTGAAGCVAISTKQPQAPEPLVLLTTNSTTVAYFYDSRHDHYVQMASPAFGVAPAAGTCGTWHPLGPSGTATAGTTTTLTSNITTVRDLAGYKIRVLSGPGAGDERTILCNTVGANAVFTVTAAFSAAITSSSTYALRTGKFYVLCAGTLAANYFKSYDVATGVWASLAITGLPATWTGSEAKMVSTAGDPLQTVLTAASATTTSITATGTTWTTSKWINAQVRITGGTGAGQVRTITANTGTVLTVATWTITPDATSTFVIEPNDDFLYIMGNAAVTLYRYSISGATTSTLTPGAARGAAPGAGSTGFFVSAQTCVVWTDANVGLNGKYIYSPRGGGVTTIDRYDIPGNTWDSITPAQGAAEAPSTGTSWTEIGGYLYCQLNGSGRFLRYKPDTNVLEGWATISTFYGTQVAALGDRCWSYAYIDTGFTVNFVYFWLNTLNVAVRIQVL